MAEAQAGEAEGAPLTEKLRTTGATTLHFRKGELVTTIYSINFHTIFTTDRL